MNDLISQIERGEVVAAEVVNGSLTKLVPDFNKTAELLRLIRNPWIPVTPETMPEDQKLVFVRNGHAIGVKEFNKAGEHSFWYDRCYAESHDLEEYTHYMIIPALPEQEGR